MGKEQEPHIAEALLPAALTIAVLGIISSLAYSNEQKQWIRNRDGNKCNVPGHHNCNGQHGANLQVHHVLPQRYCKEHNINPDTETNGITICEFSHQNLVHPNMREARRNYHKDKRSYNKAFADREDKLKHRQVYWNTRWDRAMQAVVYRNLQRFHGKPFPKKRGA